MEIEQDGMIALTMVMGMMMKMLCHVQYVLADGSRGSRHCGGLDGEDGRVIEEDGHAMSE